MVWRAIAKSGPEGVEAAVLNVHFSAHGLDRAVISGCLRSLRKMEYIVRWPIVRSSLYRITATCRIPEGETRPAWLGESLVDDDPPRRKLPEGVAVVMPSAPASVFNLDSAFRLPFSTPKGANLGRARPPREPAPETAPVALGWKPAPVAAPVAEPAAETPPPARVAPEFVCSIDSDGELYVFADGVELELSLQHTRKLLHYLDHMRAIELVESLAGEAA